MQCICETPSWRKPWLDRAWKLCFSVGKLLSNGVIFPTLRLSSPSSGLLRAGMERAYLTLSRKEQGALESWAGWEGAIPLPASLPLLRVLDRRRHTHLTLPVPTLRPPPTPPPSHWEACLSVPHNQTPRDNRPSMNCPGEESKAGTLSDHCWGKSAGAGPTKHKRRW